MIPQIDDELILPDESDRKTLVFIHGGCGDKNQWYFQYDYFRAKGSGVLVLSLSGHGKSSYSPNNSILDYSKEVVERRME